MFGEKGVSVSEALNKQSGQERARSAEDEVSVSFSAEVYKMLEEIARKKGKSVTEVIEDAIGLERWYLRTREEGGKVIIEHQNGDVWELMHD